VIPVVHLVAEVGVTLAVLDQLLALAEPDAAAVPVAAQGGNVPDVAGLNALHAFEIAVLVAALGAGANADPFSQRIFIGGQDLADAGAVHADRLLGEDVFAGGHRGLNVHRPEAGRRRQDDVVGAAVDHLLMAVEADEAAVFGQVDLVAQLLDFLVLGLAQEAISAP